MDFSRSCDVAVVGLGAMGSAALYQLAKRGVKAIGIDRFAPPHDQGSTHGETRITRQAIGEGEIYVPLALRSHEIWKELEAETGERLLVQNGCLVVDSASSVAGGVIRAAFLERTRKAAMTYKIPHEMLDAAEIRRRYPQFTPKEHEIGYFEPEGGYLNPERCVAVQLERARAMGAVTQLGTRVVSVSPDGEGVRIVTDQGELLAGHAIVSAGAWAPTFLGAPFRQLLSPSRQVMHWFEVEPDYARHWSKSPVFIWCHGTSPNDFFYGFPSLSGSNAVKTAGEQYDVSVHPDEVERTVTPAESAAMCETHLAGRVRGLRPDATRAVTCLYTVTPDSHFLIDRHPESERILVVSPCSGHGFKHSAAIGEVAAQQIENRGSSIDISAFALSRFPRARSSM
ncbi:N-methyl-L-tryptophan oxidase [Microvirga makkahensis]|uniref:N-methyl-L-tryptophan oxidase n=1 Tax=Microvirga makkahensis TaxID=1128670 RepID=A0A7X3MQL8_9HYPH|nr:N-methyl-L-tryptophan oxidase [Microvirga makkahensis]MXQ11411.1 N-methyl-L-tryptophan oxidase [Microvirga makkahensis]